MSFQSGARVYSQGFGTVGVNNSHIDVRNPATTDILYKIGTNWVNTIANTVYQLTSQTSSAGITSSTWTLLGAGEGDLNTLTTDDSTVVMPSAGNINLAGASPISTTGSGATATINLSGTVSVAHGGTGATTLTSHGVLVGAGTGAVAGLTAGSSGQVLIGSTGANPAFGTLTTSTGIAYTTGAGSLAIDVKTGGYAVSAVAGTSQACSVQTCYVANNASQTTFTLPGTSAVGDEIEIVGSSLNTAGWTITYSTNQIIWGPGGHSTLTSGAATSAGAAAQCIKIKCTIANTTWVIVSNSGTITLS